MNEQEKSKNAIIDIQIDELTPCLRDSKTKEIFKTEIIKCNINQNDSKTLNKEGWKFDWSLPKLKGYEIYQLKIKDNPTIQGMIALKSMPQNMTFDIYIIEANPENVGKDKKIIGIGPHLFAYACKRSFDEGYGGFVEFTAKTNLIEYYKESLGAKQLTAQRMYIDEKAAKVLINTYYGGD